MPLHRVALTRRSSCEVCCCSAGDQHVDQQRVENGGCGNGAGDGGDDGDGHWTVVNGGCEIAARCGGGLRLTDLYDAQVCAGTRMPNE